jgi:pyruvate formate lyase activating enzyme
MFDMEKCLGCKSCIDSCPNGAISFKDNKAYTDREKCNACGSCVDHCIYNLRNISGKEYDVETLIKEVMKDKDFYEESGGGVTLSGGEVMTMDMDFIEELLTRLFELGISITIDTCGYTEYSNFERILPYVNTFLYDIKVIDNEMHKQYVGRDNTLILENLNKLSSDGARIYIRIPVIKEVNGSEEGMEKIIEYLLDNNIKPAQINLLPYHSMGSNRYDKLAREYKGINLTRPSDEEMKEFVKMFQVKGFQNTKIGG